MPIGPILDALISHELFDTRKDEYQEIMAEQVPNDQIRKLLDRLAAKDETAIALFRDALQDLHPDVLKRCTDPKDELSELQVLLKDRYQSDYTSLKPMVWLGEVGELPVSSCMPDLAIVEKEKIKARLDDHVSTTTHEQRHLAEQYASSAKQTLVPLRSIFPDPTPKQTRDDRSEKPSVPPRNHTDRSSSITSSNADRGEEEEEEDNPSDPPVREVHSMHATKHVASPEARGQPSNSPCESETVVSREQEASRPPKSLRTLRAGLWGGAGLGKTACCAIVTSLHASGQLWSIFTLLIMLKLRDYTVQQATSLAQLLCSLLPEKLEHECKRFAQMIEASKGEGVLVVLDGVDEFEADKHSYVHHLLSGKVLTKACVLATSRPCNAARIYFEKFDKNLEILGFSDRQVEMFVEEQLGSELGPKLKRYLDQNPALASLMTVPLLALFVCHVFKSDPKNPPATRTELYSRLIVLILRRGVFDKKISFPSREQRVLEKKLDLLQLEGVVTRRLLNDLSQIAWAAHKKNKAIFDERLCEKAVTHSDSTDDLVDLGFLSADCTTKQLNIVQNYSFQHLTLQEFMVAYHTATTSDDEEALTKKLNEMGMTSHSHVVLQFMAGLLQGEVLDVFLTKLNSWLHHEYHYRSDECQERVRVILQCVKETTSNNALQAFPKQLQLPEKVWLFHVTAADVLSLSPAVQTSHTIYELGLEFDGVRDEEKEEKKATRVQKQTTTAMASLLVAMTHCSSLKSVDVYGPYYNIFQEAWRPLLVIASRLEELGLPRCALDDNDVTQLCTALHDNTSLEWLNLQFNHITDIGVQSVLTLKHITTMRWLYLTGNDYGSASRLLMKSQLAHIPDLGV